MKEKKSLLSLVVIGVFVCFISACQSTKQTDMLIGNIKAANADEAEVYSIVAKVQEYISSSQWDKWLALYADDAVLTAGDKKFSKSEMRKSVEGLSYKITNMEVLKQEVGTDAAYVSTRMLGNGREHLESYKLAKIDGQWLITEEMNP